MGNVVDIRAEKALSDSDLFLRDNLRRQRHDAEAWADYRKRLMLKALEGSPTYTLELVREYAEARAREIIARRAHEGCFPGDAA